MREGIAAVDAATSSSSRTPTSSTTPRTCPTLLAPLLEGDADVVYGTRLRGGEPQRAHLFWHYVGNRSLSLLTNVLYNTTISDMEVGYKAFRGDLIRSIELVSDDFRFEPEVTAKVLRAPASASTRCRSPTTGARSTRARRSRGATASRPSAALVRFRFLDR